MNPPLIIFTQWKMLNLMPFIFSHIISSEYVYLHSANTFWNTQDTRWTQSTIILDTVKTLTPFKYCIKQNWSLGASNSGHVNNNISYTYLYKTKCNRIINSPCLKPYRICIFLKNTVSTVSCRVRYSHPYPC